MVGLGGENIGTAYIRILADGNGLDRSIRDQLDSQGVFDAFDENGRKTSERWRKAFEEEQRKEPNQRELRDALAGPLARGDWLSQTFFRSKNWEDFKSGLKNEYGKAGERAGQNFEKSLLEGMDFKTLKGRLQNITQDLLNAQKQLDSEQNAEHMKMLNEAYGIDKNYNAKRKQLLNEAYKMNKDFDKKNLTDYQKMLKDAYQSDKDFNLRKEQLLREAYQMNRDFDSKNFDLASRMNRELDAQLRKTEQDRAKLLRDTLKDFKRFEQETNSLLRGEPGARDRGSLLNDFARLRGVISSNHLPLTHLNDDFKRNEIRLREFTPILHKVTLGADKFGTTVGKVFGKGSRNNFLNFVGSFVGGLASFPGMLSRGAEEVVKFGRKIQGVFSEADSVTQGFVSILGTIGTSAAAGIAGLVLLAGAVAVLILVIGPLVALLSLLLGALVALASTILLAAVGAIAALAGAIIPLALGIGAVVVGLVAFTKKMQGTKAATGPLKQIISSLKQDFIDLGKVTDKGLMSNLPQQLQRLHGFLSGLGPLFQAAGFGASHFFDMLLNGLQSKAFAQFESEFSKVLPGMLRTLGDIAGHALTGLTGTFRALIPLTQHFLHWLDGVVTQWSNWANSKQGQQDIKDFLKEAAASAKQVGHFLLQAGGFLADLIDTGASQGNKMFGELTQKVKEFRDFITKPIAAAPSMAGRPDPTHELPKNQTTSPVANWFADAKKFADELGTAAVQISGIIDKLDSPEARQNLLTIMDLINKIAAAVNAVPAITNILVPGGALAFHFPDILGWLSRLQNNPLVKQFDLAHLLGLDGNNLSLPHLDLSKIFGGGGRARTELITTFAGIAPKILAKIGNVNVAGIIHGTATAVGRLVGAFVGTAGKILSHISPVNVTGIIVGAAKALSSLLSTFTGAAKKILGLVGPVNVSGIFSGLAAAAQTLVSWATTLAHVITAILSNITPHINWPSPPAWLNKVTASGGIFAGAQTRIIGEAGPEAVVPLNRPLNMVDPAVRWLSAIAQGKDMPMAAGGVVGGGKQVTVTQNIFSPQADPRAVAVEAINHLVAVGY